MKGTLISKDIETLRAFKQLEGYPDLQKDAVAISMKMLKAAGRVSPTQLGAAAALCLELALFVKHEGKTCN